MNFLPRQSGSFDLFLVGGVLKTHEKCNLHSARIKITIFCGKIDHKENSFIKILEKFKETAQVRSKQSA